MKHGRMKYVWLTVLIAVLGGGFWWFQKRRESQAQPQYEPHTIARGDLRVTIISTGKVEPESRLELKPPIVGRIEDIKVDEGDTVTKGQIIAYMSSTDRAALLDLARSKGSKETAELEDIYRPTPLIAPISGTIIAKNVEPGQMITATEAAFVLSDRPIVVAQVDETDLSRIRVGQTVEISLDAYPRDHLTGDVYQIAFESKTVNNVTIYDVKIRPKDHLELLRSGMTANINFKTEEKKDVVLIPIAYTRQISGETSVMIPTANSAPSKNDKISAEQRTIKLGLSDGKMAEVLEGLKEGDVVLETVTGGDDKGKSTTGRNPMMPFSGQKPRNR